MKTTLFTIVTVVALAVAAGLLLVFSGIPDVAATAKPAPMVHWALAETRENAVRRRAAEIEVPALGGDQMTENGFRGYREMCASCHTPPGKSASPVAKGLNPPPPDLADAAETRSPAEMFWVIKHGIQMTGMPAWGPTHSDQEIWELVAFLRTLPELSAEDYAALDDRLAPGHGHGGQGSHGEQDSASGGSGDSDGHHTTPEAMGATDDGHHGSEHDHSGHAH